jgi:hypothetical protein
MRPCTFSSTASDTAFFETSFCHRHVVPADAQRAGHKLAQVAGGRLEGLSALDVGLLDVRIRHNRTRPMFYRTHNCYLCPSAPMPARRAQAKRWTGPRKQ